MVEEEGQPIEVNEVNCNLDRVGLTKGKVQQSTPGREGGQLTGIQGQG